MQKIDLKEMRKFSTFKNTHQLNKSVYSHIETIRKHERPESFVEVLLCLGRHSLRISGVSFMKHSTIAEELGISRSTVLRAMKWLKEMGIIDTIATVKKWRKSVNITRILPYVEQQGGTSEEMDEPNNDNVCDEGADEQSFNYKQSKPKRVRQNLDNLPIRYLDKSYIPNNIPTKFGEVAFSFFDIKKIYKLWNKVRIACKKLNVAELDYINPIVDALKQTVTAYKLGRIKSSFDGYFYTTVCSLITVSIRKKFAYQSPYLYNWLEE